MLGEASHREVLDDAIRSRVDDVDRVALRVRDVDERAGEAGCSRQVAGRIGGVDIDGVTAGTRGKRLNELAAEGDYLESLIRKIEDEER